MTCIYIYTCIYISYLAMQVEGITTATLMGTIGGNLGMFTGISVMTVPWGDVRSERERMGSR